MVAKRDIADARYETSNIKPQKMENQQILHSKIYGQDRSGVPLLVIHGFLGMLDNWGSFGKEMEKHFPVHLLDLRNHGKSFWADEMTHDDLAHDILNYMQFQNIEKANLLGHSLGGKAVMQFAINYPIKVNKLIVVDISPKAYPPHHQGILKALESIDLSKATLRQEVEEVLAQYIPEKSVIQFLTKNLYWNEEKKLAWRFNLKILTQHYNDFVANAIKYGVFSGSTLFIKGQKSNYILPQDKFQIKQQFPNSQIVEIARSSHWVQADNPKDFNEAVSAFLL